MESTCFKTLKLQTFCKMFGERCEPGAPLVLQNSFKLLYRDETTTETSTLPAICIFSYTIV